MRGLYLFLWRTQRYDEKCRNFERKIPVILFNFFNILFKLNFKFLDKFSNDNGISNFMRIQWNFNFLKKFSGKIAKYQISWESDETIIFSTNFWKKNNEISNFMRIRWNFNLPDNFFGKNNKTSNFMRIRWNFNFLDKFSKRKPTQITNLIKIRMCVDSVHGMPIAR
jgi:hypothetical protein